MEDRGNETPTNDLNGSKELEVTINGPVEESANTSNDDEFLL